MMGKIQFICRKPGKKSIRIIERDHRIISASLTREYSFVFKHAKGCYVYDVDGRKYLDFAAGVAVAGIGHTNPVVEKAIHKQIKLGIHSAFSDFYAELPLEFSEFLLTFMPKQLDAVFLSNSGTESIEAAYKLARWHTKKKWVIAFENAFHGRTMGSLSLTKSKPVQRDRYSPFLPVKHVPFPYYYRMKMEPEDCSSYCLTELERAIRLKRGDVAAVFLEPVQGEGGYIVPPRSFAKGVRKLCNEYGVLLCDDEVQSGCFRTGRFLAIENFGVVPDIVSLSKAIGGGVPLGATVASRKVMDWVPGSHACFNRRAKVILADGSRKEISEIVNKRLEVSVISYNPKTGVVEPKRVINWFKKKNACKEWYKVITSNSINGEQSPCVTKEHKYWVVGHGWKTVENLQKTDKILLPIPKPNKIQEQIILGSLLGDGGLSKPKAKDQNAKHPHLTIGHKESQLPYLKFKFHALRNLAAAEIKPVKHTHTDGYKRQQFYVFRTINHPYFLGLRNQIYGDNGKCKITRELLEKLEPLGLAIWYMDDGSINKWRVSLATVCFEEETIDLIISYFKERYNLIWKKERLKLKGGEIRYRISLNKENGSEKFMKMIAPYIVGCMGYKLKEKFREEQIIEAINMDFIGTNFCPQEGEVIKVVKAQNKKRDNTLYDIEVEDNHNYFIPTALVSNSTFGGNLLACAAGMATLKFMKQKRLGNNAKKVGKHVLKRLNELKDKYEIVGDVRGIGLMIGVELVKNKKSRMPAVEERKEVLCKAGEKGLILLPAGKSVIRICPPLTLTRQQADNGIDIIEDSIKELNKR